MRNSFIFKLVIVLSLVIMIMNTVSIYGAEWWTKSYEFWNGKDDTEGVKHKITRDYSVLSEVTSVIKLAGNAVFIVVAVVLGIKYMLGSAEGKTDVKEGLISLTVAMMLFYGWSALETIFIQGESLIWVKETEESTIASIYDTIIYLLHFVSLGVLVYIGIKYIFAGAEGRAELKGKGVPFVIGTIMAFATLTFLNFLRVVIDEII